MNKMRTIVLVLVVLFLLTGCGSNSKKKQQEESTASTREPVPTIDLYATYPQKNDGHDCKLEYIPLEKKNDAFIHRICREAYVSDERIIITNQTLGDVLVYDGKGKILHHFNHKGGGPKEYSHMRHTVYDNKTMEIFVFTYGSVVVYTETGEYVRSWSHGKINSFMDVFNFDDESFVAHVESSEKTDSSYVFISKKDGEILSFVNLPASKAIATVVVDTKNNIVSMKTVQQLFNDGDGFLLAPISLDTVYHLNRKKQLTPVFAKYPSVKGSEAPMVLIPAVVNDQFIFFIKFIFRTNEQPEGENLYYDRTDKMFYKRINWGCSFLARFMYQHTELPGNWYASLLGIHWIKECIEEGEEVDDKLKELAKTLDDDDNPVLEIIKFK
jgi:hypothetical protein